MRKKKIIFLNNHFQYSDGTVRALIGVVNNLDPHKFDITVKSLYRCDYKLKQELRDDIKLEKCFGFYFRGFSKIAKLIPHKILYNKFIGGKYDIEVAFQCDLPTILIGNSYNKNAVHIAWMHGYQLYPKEYKKCDKVVCVSKYCADKVKKALGNTVDVTYKYNILNDEEILNLSKEKVNLKIFQENFPIFITVGRLSPEKGYVRLVNIMSDLKNMGYKFHLIIIGNGPEYEQIESKIKELNMEDFITMTGETKNPHKYTKKSDVFICSSFSEGYSTACTEAAILGVPIITTNVPGGEEIINDCKCGALTGLDDNSLKESIKKVLDNPKIIMKWKKIMSKSCNKFKSTIRKENMNNLFNEIYNISNYKIQERRY